MVVHYNYSNKLLNEIWAKSSEPGQEKGQTLTEHTWEVLCRLREIANLRPWLPEYYKFPKLWHILFWAVFFHDWGKAAKGFQNMLRGGRRWGHRHEVLSLVYPSWILSEEDIHLVTYAIISHHKDARELRHLYPIVLHPDDRDVDDLLQCLLFELEEQYARALWWWLKELVPDWIKFLGFDRLGIEYRDPIPEKAAIQLLKPQICLPNLKKLLRSYYRIFRKIHEGEEPELILKGIILRGYIIQADHAASAATGKFLHLSINNKQIFSATKIDKEKLYEHQRQAMETKGSAVLVAPTGSGKTEAALFWAARQTSNSKNIPRLFYVLPYQASMNAMYDRLAKVFPDQVGLLHSRSVLAIYQRLLEQEYTPADAKIEARWARNLAKLNYHPVKVFSPYQMLKATFRLKGYEAILTDYAGAAFIFDEIHAYEPKRLALILETVRYLTKNFESKFFVMSATLPTLIMNYIVEALGNPIQIRASNELFESFRRHKILLCEGELLSASGIQKIIQSFLSGKSVLVTCNTITRAQEAYRMLSLELPQESLLLIHGGFNGRDRLFKEHKIIEATGAGKTERKPVIVISTQVIEVSLNIDLDILFTDPAPLEALIQRFGRINRKMRKNLAPIYVFKEPKSGQGVYHKDLVIDSMNILEKYATEQPLNEALLQTWLDEIYRGETKSKWETEYKKAAEEFRNNFLASLRPFDSDSALEEEFYKLFNGTEVLPFSLSKEYINIKEENPIEASMLLVPVSWTRWKRIQQRGLVCSNLDSWPPVVNLPYSHETGFDYSVLKGN